MAVVIASNLRKELAGDVLFDGVSFKVERRQRLALSGPNGAGKTTLLRVLAAETERHGGDLSFQKGTRIALHDQRPPLERALSLREYVLSGAHDLIATERELAELEQAMADGDHDARMLRRYADAQARLEHAGGYGWREHVGSVVRGLGFSDAQLDRPLATFSGGELTRASLARALAGSPDLLLLDEPTNHLDVESLEWLEKELVDLDAAVIIVAHDRWFLEAVTTATLELEAGRSTYFPGTWSQWRQERTMRLAAASKAAARYDADIERLARFVERFRAKKNLAKRAQAKATQITRLEKERRETVQEIALLTRRSRTLGFEFLKPARSGRVVVEAEGVGLSIGDRTLLAGGTFALDRGEHVVLLGPNGTGKTTLLETILGRRGEDSPIVSRGKVKLGHGVIPAYFSQHEVELDGSLSLLETAQKATGLQRPQAQQLLGRFLFSGWNVHEQKVGSLSGGERRRLALALVVASGANFLVLDEPTNHLDLESREALEAALQAFPGTVLLVSHDRALVDAVAERTLAIEGGTIVPHDGGFAEYAARRAELARPAPKPRKEPKARPEKPAKPQPKRKTQLELVEAEIAEREASVAALEAKLAADWGDVEVLAAHRRARDELHALLARWEALFEDAAPTA